MLPKPNLRNLDACPYMQFLVRASRCKIHFLETWGLTINTLILRFWLALIFLKSAATKVVDVTDISLFGQNIPFIHFPYTLQESTYMLFEYEYNLPHPELLAPFATFAEIILPLMLILGFGTRITAFGLGVMSLVIHITYSPDTAHYMWMMFSAILVTTGSGYLGIDHLIRKRFLKDKKTCVKTEG